MAIKTEQIIKRIRDRNLTDSESDRRKVDLAIAFLEICAKEAHEYTEFCRLRLDARKEGSKFPLPESRLSLWTAYMRECDDFEGPIDPYIEDDNSPPSIIAAAIETLVNAEAFNGWENIDPEPKKIPAAEPSKESYSDQEREQIEDGLDASSNKKPEATKPFELIGQLMRFSDGVEELLNETEAKFVKIIMDKSKEGLVAYPNAFQDKDFSHRTFTVLAEIKKNHPRTAELIRSKRGQGGYHIPRLFPH